MFCVTSCYYCTCALILIVNFSVWLVSCEYICILIFFGSVPLRIPALAQQITIEINPNCQCACESKPVRATCSISCTCAVYGVVYMYIDRTLYICSTYATIHTYTCTVLNYVCSMLLQYWFNEWQCSHACPLLVHEIVSHMHTPSKINI